MINQGINFALKACDRAAEVGVDDIAVARMAAERLLRYASDRHNTRGGGEGVQVCTPSEEIPSNTEEKPDMLAAALDYLAKGLPVFPVKGKVPLTPHGFKDATIDEATIRSWWRKWPEAGIAVPTGVASGWLVLDSDPRHGGDASLCELIEQHGDIPDTLEAETGGGGHHIIFDFPELAEIGNARGSLPEGLDVRGEGGYIVVAPSLHASGRRYRWRNALSLAPVPEWLLKLLTEDKGMSSPSGSKSRPQADSRAAIGAVIAEGKRNEALFKIGCSMRGKGAELAEIEAELSDINARRCSPPLPESEVSKIARSASSYQANRAAVGV
jgi:Bifunctional DNA primase/polymerase, N-terminal/Primase C terminal 1 (PriCT-1)